MNKIKLIFVTLLLLLVMPVVLGTDTNSTEVENSTDENITALESPVTERNATIMIFGLSKKIDVNEELTLNLGLSSQDKEMTRLVIDWGQGSPYDTSIPTTEKYEYAISEDKTYTQKGNYNIKVKVYCGTNLCAEKSEQIEVEEEQITDEKPTVTLISPSDKVHLKADKVTFSFKANDDFKINKCTFELYKKDSDLQQREYSQEVSNPQLNTEMSLNLEDFEDANYTWFVICQDNKSQTTEQSRSFTIQTTNYAQQKEVESLLEDLEKFMEKENSLSLDAKEAIEELGLSEDLKYYKKRLTQIDLDLGNNIKQISDPTLKEKRRLETLDELNEIKKKVPKNIEVVSADSYIKNSLSISLEEVITKYFQSKNTEIDKRRIKKLVKINEELQKKISVSSKIKKVKITYNNSVEDILIVNKEIKTSDPIYKNILEVLPNGLNEEVEFKTKSSKINNQIQEIDLSQLDSKKITYFVKGNIGTNKIKESETILFEKSFTSSNSITGFSVFQSSTPTASNPFILSLAFLLLGAGTFFIIKKSKMNPKNEHAKKAIHLTNKGLKEIKKESLEEAKKNYHQIKQIYPSIPEEVRKQIYCELEKLRVEIDKKEIRNLIREYEELKKFDKEKAKEIYTKIKDKYTRLPKKYQQKIYERLF